MIQFFCWYLELEQNNLKKIPPMILFLEFRNTESSISNSPYSNENCIDKIFNLFQKKILPITAIIISHKIPIPKIDVLNKLNVPIFSGFPVGDQHQNFPLLFSNADLEFENQIITFKYLNYY